MNYFKVIAKFGHVGRNNYYEGTVYVKAVTAKEAALCVRYMPRVKHHHKDAILSVEKIDCKQYKQGKTEFQENPYFSCKSIQEQKAMCANLYPFIKVETTYYEDYYCGRNYNDGRQKRAILQKLYRKQDKYCMYECA